MSVKILEPARQVLFFFILLPALLAVACRPAPALPGPGAVKTEAPASGPVHLTLWHSESGPARQELEALARDLTSAFPNMTAEAVYVGSEGDLDKKLAAAIALNQTPDVVLAPRRQIAQFARQGGLVTLDGFMTDPEVGLSSEDQTDFFPGALDEGIYNEFNRQTLAYPFDLDGLVLFYNADLLQASGLQPPANWDDFLDAASKVTKDEQYGWAMTANADVFSAMLVSRGSAPIDAPERRALFAERAGLAAMTLAAQLEKSGAALLHETRASAIADMGAGKALFYMDWMSAVSDLESAQKRAGVEFSLGLTNLPQSDIADPYMLVRGSDLAVLKGPPARVRGAWLLIRWLTASKQIARWSSAADSIPLRASALTFLTGEARSAARLRQIQGSLGNKPPHLYPQSANRRMPLIDHLMEEAWLTSLQPKADIADTLEAARDNANSLLTGSR